MAEILRATVLQSTKRDVAHTLVRGIPRTVIPSTQRKQLMAPESRNDSELSLPKDLLSEVQRHIPTRGGDFQIEGFKPSLVSKMFGFLDRGRSRE
jgi:hypothetical protein